MKKVLVPVAEGGLDNVTLEFAKSFADTGAQLLVATVLPFSDKLARPQVAHFAGLESQAYIDVAEEVLASVTKQLNDAGVTGVTTTILKGDPASEIIDFAEAEKCDLILIHTHGMGVIRRFTVGSVTNTIVHHSTVPVLVVK